MDHFALEAFGMGKADGLLFTAGPDRTDDGVESTILTLVDDPSGAIRRVVMSAAILDK